MASYYEILWRALRKGDFADARWRRELYDRSRRMLQQRLRAQRSRPGKIESKLQLAALDATIESIESEFRQTDARGGAAGEGYGQAGRARPAAEPSSDSGKQPAASRMSRGRLSSLAVAVAVAAAAAGAYVWWTARAPQDRSPPAVKPSAKNEVRASSPAFRGKRRQKAESLPAGELAPGIDGGSSDADVAYVFRRQPVFYRTTHPAGTIIIDKQQRFLYLIQPNSVALRYGIGLGAQCADLAGLRRISSVVEWPEWQPTPELVARRLAPPGVLPGRPGNPLGARLIQLEDGSSIHGTNAPKSIGSAALFGCIRLVNDDIADLAQRVSVGGRVVVSN